MERGTISPKVRCFAVQYQGMGEHLTQNTNSESSKWERFANTEISSSSIRGVVHTRCKSCQISFSIPPLVLSLSFYHSFVFPPFPVLLFPRRPLSSNLSLSLHLPTLSWLQSPKKVPLLPFSRGKSSPQSVTLVGSAARHAS